MLLIPWEEEKPLSSYTMDNLVGELQKLDNSRIILCYVDEEIAGIANCFIGFSSFKARPLINIHDFAITPKFRGMSLSKVLLETVQNIAEEKQLL